MSPGATFERVYLALKAELGSGRFRPGDPLEPGHLSEELSSSITPVRDALHRLVGERLVEAPKGDGFRMPLVTEAALRHLYRWNASLLDLAIRAAPAKAKIVPPENEPDIVSRTETLFKAIAALPANPEHILAIESANARLRPMRKLEVELIEAPDQQLEALSQTYVAGDGVALRRIVAAYHRHRERLAAAIVERLYAD